MAVETVTKVGFIGLGLMGEPMALNLARAGTPLTVWNRTAGRTRSLKAAGAQVAGSAAEVFDECDTVILMLADEPAMDAVLQRQPTGFGLDIAGRTVVHMGTTSPSYSTGLGMDIEAAGGRYVEAPVSGSREPARNGRLVAMLAGEAEAADAVEPLLAPMCRQTQYCGPVPGALLMKLSINLFLITMVTGLAEAAHFAERHGLDMERFLAVHDAGPMASDVSRTKLHKIVTGDLAAQAAAGDVLKNNRLIFEAAREAGVPTPLLDACYALFDTTVQLGHGGSDMVSVLEAIRSLKA
ncbi:NAD(P)-dependent oxidoreductase [Streptomyces griseoluteus]